MSEMIIRSILDTDLYKFTTGYAYMKLFPRAWGRFEFIDRNNLVYPDGFAESLRQEIVRMSELRLTREEADFLRQECPYLPPVYIDYLKGYSYDPEEVTIEQDAEGHLHISAEGLLYRITLWETPILAMVSELYYRETGQQPDLELTRSKALEKAQAMQEHGCR